MSSRPSHTPADEARTLSRYLVAREPSSEVADRYARAVAELMPFVAPEDQHLVDLAISRPYLLGPIDTATSVLLRDSCVRKKLLLMAAILETTPDHARLFLPCAPSRAGLLVLLIVLGLKTAFQLPVGAVILWSMERAR